MVDQQQPEPSTGSRLAVAKTYKLYLGGKFPRSESGRTYPVFDSAGGFLANAAQGSRKDARDAVSAARKAFAGWSGATAYNRGQVVYRIAEMLEGRRADVAEVVAAGEGVDVAAARNTVDLAVDRLVHYAGWTDKVATVFGGANPVAGPFFAFSVPEPTGVVAAVAPRDDSLLGLVSVLAPIVSTGNSVVVVASQTRPLPAIVLGEILATSDVPGGVVNILTGSPAEMFPWLARHGDVNALDLTGADPDQRGSWERDAAGTVKRVFSPPPTDFTRSPGTARLRAFLETKSVWHPTGSLSLSGGSSY
ncbi:aldehyde dehydrogenase family protein [Nakamurella deserti]|uniref:aldehyde dehydrogenase family protein n=1 Tax=Nakamurella deserti TaxID=2164074 RepID=UPI000DBE56E0|nr:aldehyde dehydrogenase family protein [Nakamurella deserti]